MENIFLFIFNSILFGVGLAMDAFSVSLANGLAEPDMHTRKALKIAGTFGVFQTAMPLIGWVCVHTIAETFKSFEKFIPWIALILLLYIGGKMLYEGVTYRDSGDSRESVGNGTLFIQGIATSIDALSVGFTIATYTWAEAITESLIIGVVTSVICIAGVRLGRTFGMKLAGKADILGGVILIGIGIEIFITGIF